MNKSGAAKQIKSFFGKLKKTPEMNMNCFIQSAYAFIKHHQQVQLTGSAAPQEQKLAAKFKKYLQRMTQVIEGNCKKIPSTPDNMYKIAFESTHLKAEFAEVVMNINVFEFEDRKHLQQFISEVYNQYTEILEETLSHSKEEVVAALIGKYEMPSLSPFVGNLLRLFTRSSRLVEAFLNVDVLERLTRLIANPDFNIQSDAYETFKEVLLFDRTGDEAAFDRFVEANVEPLFKIFDALQADANYFCKREGLKAQYMLLARQEGLRQAYTHDKERLKTVMQTVLSPNKGIQYEAFLLLSLYVLMPLEDNDQVRYILKMNQGNLNEFIKTFQVERDEPDFVALKNRMREVLNDL